MKKLIFFLFPLFAFTVVSLHAADLSDLNYTTTGGKVTITDCNKAAKGELVIPDTIEGNPVTSIGESAFSYCERLTSITIPDSVTSIGERAFWNCYNLTSITIPDGVTSIEENTFLRCFRLTSVTLGNSVTSIGKSAFAACGRLASITIPESVTSIGERAFFNCKMTSITIPDGVTSIEEDTFAQCDRLTSVTIGNGVTSIADGAFKVCTSLTSITIPDSVIYIGGSSMWGRGGPEGNGAFQSCTSLTSITIGNGVTSIGDDTFKYCYNLTSITIGSSVTRIGERAFESCSRLTSIKIPASVSRGRDDRGQYKGIGDYAFKGCTSLRRIIFQGSAPSVGPYTFRYVANGAIANVKRSRLSGFGSEGESWKGLILRASSVVGGLTWTTTGGQVTILDCDQAATGELVIPDTIEGNPVTSIEEGAFFRCTSLTSITIPDSVTSIGRRAFNACSSLTSITIGSSVTSIGERAFEDCTDLTRITFEGVAPTVAANAFVGVPALSSFGRIGTGWNGLTLTKDAILIYATTGGQVTIIDCDEAATGELVIPDTIEGNPVTSIVGEALANCASLTSITIPDSVTSIGRRAFNACSSLTSITIGSSVTSIGHEAFRDCSSLTSITIPDSVTSIGERTFSYCSSLTSITIPDSVTSIGERAFSYCSSLTSITIGNGVTSIGDGAFEDCTNLTAITFQGAAPTVGVEAFLNVPDEAVARVPSESLGSYRWYGLNLRTGDQFDTITDLEAQLAEAIVQKDAAIAERDARPTLFQLGAAEADRDAVIADIQLAFDEVNAVGGGVEDDLASIVDPANAPLDTLKAGVIAQPLESFEVTTLDSLNNLDIGLGLYDTDGNLLATNDDADPTVQSQLSFPDGLAGGVYYLAVGTDNSVFNSDFEVSSTGLGGEYALTLPTGPVSGTLEPSGVVWYCIEIGTDFAVLELQPLTDLYRNLVEDNATAIKERDAAIKERDAAIKERDAKIAELEQGGGGQNLEQVLEQVTDARAGSVVINLSNGEASISFNIEESEDLKTWQATGEKITKTIQLKDGKKFYRFALDK